MLRPSYTELMNVINQDENFDNKVTSRYTIVIAAAKRARQIIDGSEALVAYNTDKAVSTAVREMYTGKIIIKLCDEKDIEERPTGGLKREQLFETEI